MSNHYDLGSQDDQDTGLYASLPGTTSAAAFVAHNLTPMKSRLAPGQGMLGCHPTRWALELLNNSFTTCDLFDRARHAGFDPYAWKHQHRLAVNGNQSFSTSSEQLLSSICLDCHYHFVFKMTWDPAHAADMCHHSKASWPLGDDHFPWHHLVWVGSDSDPNIANDQSKYYPLLARENFVCSAPPCTFTVTLEISQPRLNSEIVGLLQDHEAIKEEIEKAREREPSRYEGATDQWPYQAPLNLNTYLKNLLDASPDNTRSISKRNKRFAVLFGPRCFSIFRELEFEEEVNDNEGIDEGAFVPSYPQPSAPVPGTLENPTALGTYRGFLEDARAEVQCLIHNHNHAQSEEKPTWCLPVLMAALRCEPSDQSNSAQANLERYKILGVMPYQSREIVVNAYKRQWDLVPGRRKELVDSLMGVANDSSDEMLSNYAITQSSLFESQRQTCATTNDDGVATQALEFLGLQPPNTYSAEALIKAFRQKLAQDPTVAETARSMLLVIARASTDDNYQAALLMEADTKLSLGTALEVLGISEPSAPTDDILSAFHAKSNASQTEEQNKAFIDALDALAEHLELPRLKQTCYEQRQAAGLGAPDRTLSTVNPIHVVDWALPVGLDNIGNTCYLNSLLQYLFTVKPVRDVVLHYDDLKLELTDESIAERRLGGNKMHMDRGEAIVAQAFARELAKLFQSLQTSERVATRPSQRLANAVLLSTHTLLKDSKSASGTTTPKPPPLPERPSPRLPTESRGDVDMNSASMLIDSDPVLLGSNSSTETLVNRENAEDETGVNKVQEIPLSLVEDSSTDVAEIRLDGSDTPPAQPQHPAESTQTPDTTVGQVMETAEHKNSDLLMAGTVIPETVDQKVLTALEHQKRSSGTDQQDVEEVMGSIINRLQAAIRPTFTDEKTGIQFEEIMKTFFVTTINYTKKFDEITYQNEVSFDRSITAFPAAKGQCSLYDALGRNFDQQIIAESKLSRYTAIKSLPPILHVLIQRSQSMGSKNGNPVEIPEILYLDRYLDAAQDSPVFRQRFQDWMLADRVADLKEMLASADDSYVSEADLEALAANPVEALAKFHSAAHAKSADENRSLAVETWDFDGPVEDDFVMVDRAPDENRPSQVQLPPRPENMRQTGEAIRKMMEDELREHETTLQGHFREMNQVPYRLHAVICHRGHLTSGHYWVWIHDFEANVWRKYNDADVKEDKNTAEVLKTLSTSGEPYFLCYVRDDDKEKYVDVPKRQRPEPQSEEPAEEHTVTMTEVDATENGTVEDGTANDPDKTTEASDGKTAEPPRESDETEAGSDSS